MKQLTEEEMLHRAAAYCSTAERCIKDVRTKIKAAGLEEEASDRIIARLIKEQFINENRFARSFVNDKLRFNKWGRFKISFELRKKEIPENICNAALEEIDKKEYSDILMSLLKTKLKSIKDTDMRAVRLKLMRFAAGRGFEGRECGLCINKLIKNVDDEDFDTF